MLPMLKFVWQHFCHHMLSLTIISTYFNWGGLFIMAALLCNEPLVRWLSQTTPNPAIILETNHKHTYNSPRPNQQCKPQPSSLHLLARIAFNSAVLVEWHPPPAILPSIPHTLLRLWGETNDDTNEAKPMTAMKSDLSVSSTSTCSTCSTYALSKCHLSFFQHEHVQCMYNLQFTRHTRAHFHGEYVACFEPWILCTYKFSGHNKFQHNWHLQHQVVSGTLLQCCTFPFWCTWGESGQSASIASIETAWGCTAPIA